MKDNKSARPRFHILFPIERMTDHASYANLKTVVNGIFPYFDTNALDAARFFYGTSDPKVEFHKGFMNLTEFLQDAAPFDKDLNQGQYGSRVIQEGSRNSTMSQYAGKIIKKFGDTDKAYQCFIDEAAKCSPPLPDEELQTIWHSAQRFFAGCIVPGTLKPLIVCPECNKCSECPYGKKNEYRQPRVINYDDPEELMSNEGEEFSGMNEAESEMVYDELIAAMNRKNPLIAEVFVRFHTYDLSAPEIAAELGIDKRTVYYLKEQGEQIRDRLMSM